MRKHLVFTLLLTTILFAIVAIVSCSKKGDTTLTIPSVSITSITNVTSSSSNVSVNTKSNGNGTITETGVCYSTSVNPDNTKSRVVSTVNSGNFTCRITGLLPETTYYVRAYATNESGTAYGNELTFSTSAVKFWIADVNFRSVLKQQIPLAFDTKDSLKISSPVVTGFKGSIDVSNKNIASLSGIEYFTALTQLNCSDNKLTTLDLSNNTTLTTIICSTNLITNLNVSKCPALNLLVCFTNKIPMLDVSKNTLLSYLDCDENLLTALDLSKNPALNSLFCYSNQLTTLNISSQTAVFDNLYILKDNFTTMNSGNTGLTTLKVNSISKQNPELLNVKSNIVGCTISTWNSGVQECGNYNPLTNSCP